MPEDSYEEGSHFNTWSRGPPHTASASATHRSTAGLGLGSSFDPFLYRRSLPKPESTVSNGNSEASESSFGLDMEFWERLISADGHAQVKSSLPASVLEAIH